MTRPADGHHPARLHRPSRTRGWSLLRSGLLIGYASGALLGALCASGLFYLVDFARVPSDLVVITLYAHLHIALAGAAIGVVVAGGAVAVATVRAHPIPIAGFRRALGTLMLGGSLTIALGGLYVISRRPAQLFAPGTLLPLLAAGALLMVGTRKAARAFPAETGDLAGPLAMPRFWGWLIVASLLAPPVYGSLSHREQPLRGDAPLQATRSPHAIGRKVLLVGWDGATWDVIDPLLRSGRLPTLARLLSQGSRGVLWSSAAEIQPLSNSASAGARSPAVWESIATGKRRYLHGIWDFECTILPGVQQAIPFRVLGDHLGSGVLTTSHMSRAKRLWELLDEVGLRTAVIGWWTTWPVTPLRHGIMVSDRAGRGLPQAVHPEVIVDNSSTGQTAVSLRGLELGSPERLAELGNTVSAQHERDLYNGSVALAILEQHRPDVVAVHFGLTDVVQHKFWRHYQPTLFEGTTPDEVRRYGDVIPTAYEFLDRMLGKLLGPPVRNGRSSWFRITVPAHGSPTVSISSPSCSCRRHTIRIIPAITA
jgi:hypothetical protein